jgi:hypothetical protein
MSGQTDKFWMVWREDSFSSPPTVKHTTSAAAKAEASRLATKHPDTRFAVLQAMEVHVATINPPQALRCVQSKGEF